MTPQALFAVISSLLGFVSVTPYILDILAHKTKPHSYSWFVWALLTGMSALLVFKGGGGIGAIPTLVGSFLCTVIFLLSLKYGTNNVTRFDGVCLGGALIATLFYLTTHDALLSVIFISSIDALATLPTLRKAFVEPYSETLSTFVISVISCCFGLLALSVFSLVTTLYLMSIIVTNLALVYIILTRRRAVGIRQ